mmetsp:Transcript_5819/g.6762  ORF Transcript_5819/g.6762 Transcript_5819/m.6762 type:complete len:387 (+) Transcript_5819:38-1198(+)
MGFFAGRRRQLQLLLYTALIVVAVFFDHVHRYKHIKSLRDHLHEYSWSSIPSHLPLSTEDVEHSIRSLHNGTFVNSSVAAEYSKSTARKTSPSTAVRNERALPGNKIFVTGPWVNERIVEENLVMNPGFEIHVFNYSAVAKSVKLIDQILSTSEVGLHGAWEAWCALIPWAYRADLWRLMILWSEGGVYLDSKVRLLAPLSDWASLLHGEEHLAICHDEYYTWKSKKRGRVSRLWSGAMAAPKGSPVLLEAIRLLIRNVQNRTYSLLGEEDSFARSDLGGMLAVTGPDLVGYAASFENFTESNGKLKAVRVSCRFYHKFGGVLYNNSYAVNPNQTGILMQSDRSEHGKVKDSGNSYSALYRDRQMYCDEKSPTLQGSPCDITSLLK